MDYVRGLTGKISQTLSSYTEKLYKGRSFSTSLPRSITLDKTITFSQTSFQKAPLLSTIFRRSEIIQIKSNNKIIPLKISDLVERLGWTEEQVKSLGQKENAYETLQEAFAIKEAINLYTPDQREIVQKENSKTEIPSDIEPMREAESSKSIDLETKPYNSKLLEFYRNHEFSIQEKSNILSFFLKNLPSTKPSLIFTESLSHVIYLDPKELSAKSGKQLGSGAEASVFHFEGESTVLKTYNKTGILRNATKDFTESINLNLTKDSTFKQKIAQGDSLFNLIKPEKHSLNSIEAEYRQNLYSANSTEKNPLKFFTELKGEFDLDSFIRKERDSEEYSTKIMSFQGDIASHYADRIHANGIAHLDGKPGNYMIYKQNNNSLTARVNDFGGSLEINLQDLKMQLPTVLGEDFNCTAEYTRWEEIENYTKKAKEINNLIQSNNPKTTDEIKSKKEELLKSLQKIDVFQMGVAFYQMACEVASPAEPPSHGEIDKESFPYVINRDKSGNRSDIIDPPTETQTAEVKQRLEKFYGKNTPQVKMILRMIDFNPDNRPTAEEVKQVFSNQVGG